MPKLFSCCSAISTRYGKQLFHPPPHSVLIPFRSAPLRILLVIIVLFTQLSWAGLIGSLLFIAVIPAQKALMSKAGVYIKEALKSTDKRVKVIGGVFSSMNVIKCYAWEASFLKKVEEIRDTELVWVLKSAYLFAVNCKSLACYSAYRIAYH